MASNDLSPDEQEFMCAAYKQAKDHPQRQVIDDPILTNLGAGRFLAARDALEQRGFVDRKGAGRGQSTGGFWVTQAGMNEAREICEAKD